MNTGTPLARLACCLATQLQEEADRRGRAVIALDGFGCCGKSTLAQAIALRTGGVVLETDDFQQPADGRIESDSPLRYRRWAALQAATLALARGEPATYAPIDWDTHRLAPPVRREPHPILIIDGIGAHALRLPQRPLRVFVDGLAATRMQRVAARDGPAFADWDRYVAVELAYFEARRPWRDADLYVLGADLTFALSADSFARQMECGRRSPGERLDRPYRTDAGPG